MHTVCVSAFWVCASITAYTYVLYPIAVWILARRCPDRMRRQAARDALPSVSLLIAAHNEEQVIEARVLDALRLDYPRDRLQVVIASDGSSDGTAATVARYAHAGVTLLDFRERRGKAAVLNHAFGHLRGDVVVLSDANTFMAPDALQALARWFSDPAVGVVCGRLELQDPATGRNVDSVYWRYENFLKACESRLGALLGANGAIYAIRRSVFTGIDNDTIVDDLVLPLLTRLRTGCSLLYDPCAVAYEQSPADISSEFKRRSRIGAGGFQSMGVLWRLLHPRHGWLAFTFFSHKVARWLCPFAIFGAIVTNLALAGEPLYRGVMIAEVTLSAIAVAGCFTSSRGAAARAARIATMFAGMNAALLVGFWMWVRGAQGGAWQRTAR